MINEFMYTIWNNFAMNLDTNPNLLTEKGNGFPHTIYEPQSKYKKSSTNAFVRLGWKRLEVPW